MEFWRQLQRWRREVIVAQGVLDASPQRKIARQLLRVEIERQQEFALSPYRSTGRFGSHPVGYRVSDRYSNERWPIGLGRIWQQTIHVGGKPVRLPRVI